MVLERSSTWLLRGLGQTLVDGNARNRLLYERKYLGKTTRALIRARLSATDTDNYLKIDGKPVFFIFEAHGIPTKATCSSYGIAVPEHRCLQPAYLVNDKLKKRLSFEFGLR